MNEWKSSGGRISLLPAAPVPSGLPSALDLYKQVWGDDPEGFQKPSNPLAASIAQGNRNDLSLSCVVQPTRVDLAISPLTSFQDPAEAQFPLISEFGLLANELLRCIGAVGRNLVPGSIFRAAIALQLVRICPDFVEANRVLTSVIPRNYGVTITNEQDFVFQVNRPYSTEIEARPTIMNAVTKWSVDRLKIVTFGLSAQGPPTVAAMVTTHPATSEFISASMSIDNNNAPSETALSSAAQAAVLNKALASAVLAIRNTGLQVEGLQNVRLPN